MGGVPTAGGADPPCIAGTAPTIAFANDALCACKHVVWEEWVLAAGTADICLATYSGMELAWVGKTSLTYERESVRAFPSLSYRNGTAYTKGYDLVWTGRSVSPIEFFTVRFLGTSRPGPLVSVEQEGTIGAVATIAPIAWPNPFHDRVTIVGSPPGHGGRLRIFDLGASYASSRATAPARAGSGTVATKRGSLFRRGPTSQTSRESRSRALASSASHDRIRDHVPRGIAEGGWVNHPPSACGAAPLRSRRTRD